MPNLHQDEIILLGTGSPRPDIQRNGSAYLLIVGDTPILIDCGDGATRQLLNAGIDLADVHTLIFTHLHSDHTAGYIQFLLGGWASGRRQLRLIGPSGLRRFHETLVHMYEEDIAYRTSLGRSPAGLLDVEVIEVDENVPLPEVLPGVRMSVREMTHSILTYAIRFDTDRWSCVFGGDTSPNEKLVTLCKDADVAVLDGCLAPNRIYEHPNSPERAAIWRGLQKEHCSPAQCGEIATRAQLKKLIITHFLPDTDVIQVYEEASKHFAGDIVIAADLLRCAL